MKSESSQRQTGGRWALAPFFTLLLAIGLVYTASCARSASVGTSSPARSPNMSTTKPSPDPRVGLRPGRVDSATRAIVEKAAETSWNVRLVSNTPPSKGFVGVTNSDLAFTGKYAIQGNYNGYQVWDISNPSKPSLVTAYLCPASQSDVSVSGKLLFVSSESASGRIDCGTEGVTDEVSHDRIRGIRIFDATDIKNPQYIANVQTCRGSHTHTVVSDPKDKSNIYVYISGSSRVRPEGELTGCADLAPDASPTSEDFRIEVIKIPVAQPKMAALVSAPHIFEGLTAPPRSNARTEQDNAERAARGGGRGGRGGPPSIPQGPSQCHDITVYPAVGLAGGACGGYGLLLDISDVANPRRIDAVADSNFSFWHSATFNNDATKILFSDEWGGGSAPRCRSTDKLVWGADAIFTMQNRKMSMKGYYKMPAPQTSEENCVAHNGSLIPIPGRDVMVQGWYQGGISVFDWTDPAHATEIAYFDRGPLNGARLTSAGSWSIYWYNGVLVSSEIARGLDVFELQPSGFISQNEIDAAKTVHLDELNAQEQPKFVWPPSFPLVKSYTDQLERSRGLSADRIAAVRAAISGAEKASGQQRRDALTQLSSQLNGEAGGSSDGAKVRMLASALTDLANAQR
jgi:LVIVD repeat